MYREVYSSSEGFSPLSDSVDSGLCRGPFIACVFLLLTLFFANTRWNRVFLKRVPISSWRSRGEFIAGCGWFLIMKHNLPYSVSNRLRVGRRTATDGPLGTLPDQADEVNDVENGSRHWSKQRHVHMHPTLAPGWSRTNITREHMS